MPSITHIIKDGIEATEPEAKTYEDLPYGKYLMQVVDSNIEEKNGNQQLVFMLEVVSSDLNSSHAGRRHWERFIMSSDNPQRQEIGRRMFGEFLTACGVDRLENTDVLVGKRAVATLKQGKPKDNGGYWTKTSFSVDLTKPEPETTVVDEIDELLDDEVPAWGSGN